MQNYRTDIYIFFTILILCSGISLAIGRSVDVQFHDTYVVIPRQHLTIMLVSVFAFATFAVRCVVTRFAIISANIFFGFACFLLLYVAWRVGQLIAVLQ